MATVRRSLGFQRYLLSLQYHGSSYLGFSYQGSHQEDANDQRSVEGCLRHALQSLLSSSRWENIQTAGRATKFIGDSIFYLQRQEYEGLKLFNKTKRRLGERIDRRNELCILRVLEAPEQMPNPWAAQDRTQPAFVDWNARFSATQRTYVYRILHSYGDTDWMVPFEWDRAWRIRSGNSLNVQAMQQAADLLVGEHDFSSFRGKGCQRSSPIVNLTALRVNSSRVSDFEQSLLGAAYSVENDIQRDYSTSIPGSNCQLVTILFQGNSFVYRQVRNLTGCLVEVGRGRMNPDDVPALLEARNRALAPLMAPAHGLFLVDVQHQGIRI